MRRFIRFTAAIAAALATIGSAFAAADLQQQHADALARIKTAAQQRTLAQTMAKSTCYLMAGVSPQMQAEQAFMASMMFDDNASALLSGGAEGITLPESDASTLAALARISEVWAVFAPASRQVMSGDFHAVPVQQLISLDPVVTGHLEDVLLLLDGVYRQRLVTRQEMVNTVIHAAGQSMLARKAMKELCYITIDLMRARMQQDLRTTIDQFDRVLAAMETGDFDLGIADPPNLAAIKQVMEIKTLWAELRPVLERGLLPEPPDREILAQAAELGDSIVALTDGMLALYLE
ncbi:hypothetical protein So717_16180 [Roseobacter cerasinus]|uniref:NarX-like N-terminal domain-containing protein n=1 Tax=Roseobacter cerasinus TaxID=2602289 RepID=A0A640VSJ2_9RHOB|nr:type IV pili methyl-accepting chemotaxis transducer N-terminal domain-containing protein [Roseobacter cerasinus]GFE49865.1 hypothetical protein So717_16180 [Roseobacter cerasinus]